MLRSNPLEVFSVYCSMKAHYGEPTYNHFKYGSVKNVTPESFSKRNDIKYFQYFASKYNIKETERFFAVNFAYDSDFWIGKAVDDDEPRERYMQNIKILEGFEYFFNEDIQTLEKKYGFKNSLKNIEGIPEIFFATVKGNISFETFSILLNILGLDKRWGSLDGFFCDSVMMRAKKFFPFLNVSEKNVIEFLKEEKWKKNLIL